MAKNFKKSLGSKNLSSLIPTTQEETTKTTPAAQPVVKKAVQKVMEPIIEKTPTPKKIPTTKTIAKKKSKQKAATTTVTTFRVNDDNLRAMKAIAFWDRKKIQEVFNEALVNYIDQVPKATLKKAMTEYERRYGKE